MHFCILVMSCARLPSLWCSVGLLLLGCSSFPCFGPGWAFVPWVFCCYSPLSRRMIMSEGWLWCCFLWTYQAFYDFAFGWFCGLPTSLGGGMSLAGGYTSSLRGLGGDYGVVSLSFRLLILLRSSLVCFSGGPFWCIEWFPWVFVLGLIWEALFGVF